MREERLPSSPDSNVCTDARTGGARALGQDRKEKKKGGMGHRLRCRTQLKLNISMKANTLRRSAMHSWAKLHSTGAQNNAANTF